MAIVLGVPVNEIINMVGHDGSDIVWPTCPEPLCRRGFHMQELITIARRMGYATTLFEEDAYSSCCDEKVTEKVFVGNYTHVLSDFLIGNRAVFCGYNWKGNPHAVAWTGNIIIDPSTGLQINTNFIRGWTLIFDLINF